MAEIKIVKKNPKLPRHMLSFDSGRPIARVIGGKYDGRTLRIVETSPDSGPIFGGGIDQPDDSVLSILGRKWIDRCRKPDGRSLSPMDLVDLELSLVHRTPPHAGLRAIYDAAQEKLDMKRLIEFHDDTCRIQPLPLFSSKPVSKDRWELADRECCYIAAPSGAGKSTYIARLVDAYRLFNPEKRFIVYSRVDEDPAFKELDPEMINVNNTILEGGYESGASESGETDSRDEDKEGEFDDSIVCFDDIDTLSPSVAERVRQIRDNLLETGRHTRTTVMCTSHTIANNKKTKGPILEATSVTLFPGATPTRPMLYYLKEYAGLTKEGIEKFMKLASRWATFYTHTPRYVIHEHGAYIV